MHTERERVRETENAICTQREIERMTDRYIDRGTDKERERQ